MREILTTSYLGSQAEENGKFGTFAGVFTPTVLTILGAIMYLRLGQVVGNAGLGGALLIIILAHVITISTGLAVSSIVTNTRVGAGGAFAIISQSLGLEVGGSVGIPLYLAQGVSVALYILAFSEAWVGLFTTHPFWLVAPITFLLVFLIAFISAQFASRIQFLILAIVIFSLIAIGLGSFPIYGQKGLTQVPQLWGGFTKWDFWQSFAIFFPAVTGIMVGISLSGDLRDARRSIPRGTMSAIFLTLLIYLALAYWLARVATTRDLLANSTIMADKAIFSWAVFLGMLGATFSSALGSLVAAPRVMRALAMHRILPYSAHFQEVTGDGEPRNALLTTSAISFAVLIVAMFSGGLDAVAEVITLFFLITYAMLNVVVVIEQNLGTVSFRPTLAIPRLVPLIGLIGCLFVMFLINPGFSLVAVIAVLALYTFLGRRQLANLQSDVRSGLFYSLAAWAVLRAARMPSAPERTWKPALLAPVSTTQELTGNYRILWAMAAPQGAVHALGIHPADDPDTVADIPTIADAFSKAGLYSRSIILEENDFVNGVRTATQILQHTFFRPNILFIQLHAKSNLDHVQQLVDKTAAYRMGVVLLARHEILELGREHYINVWVSAQGPDWKHDLRESNQDLVILLAYQLATNWQGQIQLCMAVPDAEAKRKAEQYLQELILLARLPAQTGVAVIQSDFTTAVGTLPRADLNIFGLPKPAQLSFCQHIASLVDSSAMFVRDSGDESALA